MTPDGVSCNRDLNLRESRHTTCDVAAMDATHLHCPRCASIQQIRFEALLPGEPALGTNVQCGHCRHVAFTLLKPARFFCDVCDDVRPALLERAESSLSGLAVQLVCGGCFDGKTLLYAAIGRSSGASAPQPQPLPGGRAPRE